MLTLPNSFSKEVVLKNPNRVIFARLYYGDETNYTAVSTISRRISGTGYNGWITRFSSPKTTWNWAKGNNVVTTTPTIELGNFESNIDNYSLIDEFYTNNYLGRKIEIYMGFQNATTTSDLLQIYTGRIEDLIFADGKISITFKATNLPEDDIAGRVIDFESNLIGDATISGLNDAVDGYRVPVAYGRHWNAPGVNVQYQIGASGATAKRYCFHDHIATSSWDNSSSPALVNSYRNFTARTERMIYIHDDDYLVPVSSEDITTNLGSNLWGYNTNNAIYSGAVVYFDDENEQIAGDSFSATIPLRLTDDTIMVLGHGGITVSGTYSGIQDGDIDTFFNILYSGANTQNFVQLVDFGDRATYNLRYVEDGAGLSVYVAERPIHVAKKEAIDATYWYGRIEANTYWNLVPAEVLNGYNHSLALRIIALDKATITAIGANYDLTQNSYERENGLAWIDPNGAQPYDTEWSCGVAEGDWNEAFVPGAGFCETATHWNEAVFGNTVYDATLSQREAIDDFGLSLNFQGGYSSTVATDFWINWRIYELFLLHQASKELPEDYIYCEIDGLEVANGADIYAMNTSDTNTPLKRPLHYIEAILRTLGYGDSNFDQTEWNNSNTTWTELYSDRRDHSGFCITESTKFNDFLKDYLTYELYTVYRDDTDKFRVILIEDEYDSNDVDATIDYNDCTRFEMSLSPLDSVVSDINGLKTDYQYFNDDYVYNTNWKVTSSGYAYDFYDYTNSYSNGQFRKEDMEMRYTSYSRSQCLRYGGSTYALIKNHTSEQASLPNADTEHYSSILTTFTKDPDWIKAQNYRCESAENYQIARRYINHFANRHRIIKLTSSDMDFYKYQIGDIVNFENVPQTLIGMSVSGFAGSTASSATINGQTAYPYFMVYAVRKDPQKVDLECFQLHKLDDLTVMRSA